MKKLLAPGLALAFAAATVLSLGARTADDSNIGTWQLNVAKSKYTPGPAPKSQTLVIEGWGDDGVTYKSDSVSADGQSAKSEAQVKYDGKFYPVTGNPDAQMVAYKRINANSVHITTQVGGKQNSSGMIVVSNDGKTRTLTLVGTNAKGQKIDNVIVYDKQ